MSFTAFNAPPPKAVPTVVKSEPVAGRSPKPIPELESAFGDRQDLLQRLQPLIVSNEQLIRDLSSYVVSLKLAAAPSHTPEAQSVNKKRKLEDGVSANDSSLGWADRGKKASHTANEVSFSVPQRKKLRLEWTDAPHGGIRAASAAGDLEFGVSWQDVDQIFALPVPEKAKKQHNFVLIPAGGHGLLPLAPGAPEPIVWTAFEPGPKDADAPPEPGHTTDLLNGQLASFGKKVILPSADEFESASPDVMRKGEPAYHVKAHRGSKDGFLFFLSHGIVFAFKKPLLFLPFSSITSVSYTSVLQRTFNLSVATEIAPSDGSASKEEEIEFSMLDQADFAGIDAYVKRHGLHDASLAASRKAKVYDVNKPRATKGEPGPAALANGHVAAEEGRGEDDGEDDDDDMTELQRAEQLLQDEEDEMEEDYIEESEDEGSSEEEDYSEGAVGDDPEGGGEDQDEDDE